MLVPRPRRRPELSAAGWGRAPGCKAFADQPTKQASTGPAAPCNRVCIEGKLAQRGGGSSLLRPSRRSGSLLEDQADRSK